MQQSERMTQHLNQLSLIWFAIVGGIILFAAVVGYLMGEAILPPKDAEFPPWTSLLLNGVALVFLVKAQLLPRLFGVPGEGASEEEWITWHKKTSILGYALREAAALIVIVSWMLTGEKIAAIFMVGLALMAMVFAIPRADQLKG
jgi:hypothetical protein